MNRSINILLLFFAFPAIAMTIFVAFDVPFDFLRTSMGQYEYRDEIFLGFGLLFLILIGIRSANRWVGVNMTRKPARFQWSVEIGEQRKKQVRLYLAIEMLISGIVAIALYILTPESWPITGAFVLMFLDQFVFMILAPKWFRVGLAQQALVIADRELRILYYSGLRRVEKHQQTIYFEYLEELQLFFPENCIPSDSYPSFREALEQKVNRDRVFFSESFKAIH